LDFWVRSVFIAEEWVCSRVGGGGEGLSRVVRGSVFVRVWDRRRKGGAGGWMDSTLSAVLSPPIMVWSGGGSTWDRTSGFWSVSVGGGGFDCTWEVFLLSGKQFFIISSFWSSILIFLAISCFSFSVSQIR
jgi:hypothetical protein